MEATYQHLIQQNNKIRWDTSYTETLFTSAHNEDTRLYFGKLTS